MAGPVAHILAALLILHSAPQHGLKVTDHQAFIVGTCYPDIHYLGIIKRETTHVTNIRWEDVVAAPTDFQKGVLFHSLVDEVRIVHLETVHGNLLPFLPIMRSQIMKFYEDSLIYNQVDDWLKISHYFDEILPEEKQAHQLSDTALQQWHQFIKIYCMQQPSVLSTHTIINQFPQLRARIPFGIPSLLSKVYMGIAFRSFNKPRLTRAIKNFYENIVHLLTSNAHLTHKKGIVPRIS